MVDEELKSESKAVVASEVPAQPEPTPATTENAMDVDSKEEGLKSEASKEEKPQEVEIKADESNTGDTKAEGSKAGETKVEASKADEPKPATEADKEATVKNGSDSNDKRKYEDNKRNTDGKHNGKRYEKRGQKPVSQYDHLPETDDPDEIRKQVEFYFSEANLHKDQNLLNKVGGAANNPIAIKYIHGFKRMKRFQPYSAVVAALKDSKFVEVNENDEVRRREPLSKNYSTDVHENRKVYQSANHHRAVYVKGFGKETPTTQLDLEAFFAPYGPIEEVRLRRETNPQSEDYNKFKESVFVGFQTEEAQQAFLALDPKPKWNGQDLLIMSKDAYVVLKGKEYAGKMKNDGKSSDRHDNRDKYRGNNGARAGRGGRGGGRFDRGRDRRDRDRRPGNRDERDWNGRRKDFQNGKSDKPKRKEKSASPKRRVDAHGIPIVESSVSPPYRSPKENATAGAEPPRKGLESPGKKRALEDASETQGEAKKVKAGELSINP
ncbi:hypothetical protein M501DRAFT_187744 [Patellaria atrata CBS 101060]|uniref:HTH La-type RNA-binding domain-containing protein n=1 Tax=Patellaria atrata CBS 101060 TaxID=1346257 RepID=A0A9P4S734_9PEZI|nr:hypothetical protein M501DRAFT_187744 [Patellaria atrata CBS 101060]